MSVRVPQTDRRRAPRRQQPLAPPLTRALPHLHACADPRKRDRLDPVVDTELERRPVAAPQLVLALPLAGAAVDRADSVRNVLGWEAVPTRQLGLARLGAVEGAALFEEVRAGCRVDRAVDCGQCEGVSVGICRKRRRPWFWTPEHVD